MLIRLVVPSLIDQRSNQMTGIIRAAFVLSDDFLQEDKDEINEILDWFNDFLKVPHKDGVSLLKNSKAISWFKISAKLHIIKARAIGDVLEKYNIKFRTLLSIHPGEIVYEDEHQVCGVRND